MKCLIVLTVALVAFVAADEEWKPIAPGGTESAKIHEKCTEESGLTEEQLAKIRRFERPDEKEVHEYILCNVKKFGVFTEENGYNTDRLMEIFRKLQLDEEKARSLLTKCMENKDNEGTPAERAYRGVICMFDNKFDDLMKEAQDKAKQDQTNEA